MHALPDPLVTMTVKLIQVLSPCVTLTASLETASGLVSMVSEPSASVKQFFSEIILSEQIPKSTIVTLGKRSGSAGTVVRYQSTGSIA